ncbi:MAG: beta/gamma crystallin-related protein [Nostoc sp.]|uniref:beta/gamma crystallin-related protein n=1 Tax=Nostoc sp. TaxID=1180 RepID=UPI002FF79918
MLNIKEYLKQIDATLPVIELDDKVAANCSGGEGYTGSNNPDVVLFVDGGFKGDSLKVNAKNNDGLRNLSKYRRNLGFNNFNDEISSFIIYKGKWNFYADPGYNGLYNSKPLGPGEYSSLPKGFYNDSLTSLKRVG